MPAKKTAPKRAPRKTAAAKPKPDVDAGVKVG